MHKWWDRKWLPFILKHEEKESGQGHISFQNEDVPWGLYSPFACSVILWRCMSSSLFLSICNIDWAPDLTLGPSFPYNLGARLSFYIISDILKNKTLDNVPDLTCHDSLQSSIIGVREHEKTEWVFVYKCDFLRINGHDKGGRSFQI